MRLVDTAGLRRKSRVSEDLEKLSVADALAEIDDWCDANGYHRPENWPNPVRQDGQFTLVVGCVKN